MLVLLGEDRTCSAAIPSGAGSSAAHTPKCRTAARVSSCRTCMRPERWVKTVRRALPRSSPSLILCPVSNASSWVPRRFLAPRVAARWARTASTVHTCRIYRSSGLVCSHGCLPGSVLERDDPSGGAFGAARAVRAEDFVFTSARADVTGPMTRVPRCAEIFDDQCPVVGALHTRVACGFQPGVRPTKTIRAFDEDVAVTTERRRPQPRRLVPIRTSSVSGW